MAAGGIATIALWLREVAPPYVENWRQGAQGEAQTHGALAGNGWTVVEDIDTGRGNYDHIVVAPGGVFLLETKNLTAIAEICDGVPWLRRRHDPEADRPLKTLRPRLLAPAAALRARTIGVPVSAPGWTRSWCSGASFLRVSSRIFK